MAPLPTQMSDPAAILARWYQLVGEMQCLMSQMQMLGITPPMPFSFSGAATSAVPSQNRPPISGPSQLQATSQATSNVVVKPPSQATTQVWEESNASAPTATPPPQEFGAEKQQNYAAKRDRGYAHEEPLYTPYVALVEFKRQRIRKYDATLFVKPGSYVVVDGDRGMDCGFVVQCATRNVDGTYGHTESIEGPAMDMTKVKTDNGYIRRLATEDEVNELHGEIARMERFALSKCRERVVQMGLEMEIVDCEFQFDRKKVTFFFDSQESVDFRDLTKDLYRIFGARIWLENINSKVKNVVPEGAIPQAEKIHRPIPIKPNRRSN